MITELLSAGFDHDHVVRMPIPHLYEAHAAVSRMRLRRRMEDFGDQSHAAQADTKGLKEHHKALETMARQLEPRERKTAAPANAGSGADFLKDMENLGKR